MRGLKFDKAALQRVFRLAGLGRALSATQRSGDLSGRVGQLLARGVVERIEALQLSFELAQRGTELVETIAHPANLSPIIGTSLLGDETSGAILALLAGLAIEELVAGGRRRQLRLEQLIDGLANDRDGEGIAFDAAGAGDVQADDLAVEINDGATALVGAQDRVMLDC